MITDGEDVAPISLNKWRRDAWMFFDPEKAKILLESFREIGRNAARIAPPKAPMSELIIQPLMDPMPLEFALTFLWTTPGGGLDE